ncbi:MAG: nucleoside deaminase [Alphaproteobacteria bacterium]|nr:nucleoside deaminase [Alphaproteobacteria bacterium]
MNKIIVETALEEAQKAFDTDEIPVGAVLFETNTGKIIATAHNQTEKMNDISAHAEILALREGGKILKTNHFSGYSLFTTLEPCPMCAGALAWSKIDRIYFGAYDPKSGGIEHGARVLNHTHHKPDIYGGLEEEKCALVMKKFFERKRK